MTATVNVDLSLVEKPFDDYFDLGVTLRSTFIKVLVRGELEQVGEESAKFWLRIGDRPKRKDAREEGQGNYRNWISWFGQESSEFPPQEYIADYGFFVGRVFNPKQEKAFLFSEYTLSTARENENTGTEYGTLGIGHTSMRNLKEPEKPGVFVSCHGARPNHKEYDRIGFFVLGGKFKGVAKIDII